nr:integrase, catalytic region, zinc finger, CCHC-type, peptidase aspartic, catalytic [Tanacetum cinerariifolium]
MQTQTSNALYNAIMEAGGKDRPPLLASHNNVYWKSRIKRYIDTKTNNELIHYCLQNIPYEYKWTERAVLVAEDEAIEIILIGIDNDIYSTFDACPNACEMWKAIERLKQGESINVQDLETNLYWEFGKFTSRDDDEMSKEKEIDKLMALISVSFKKIYKPTNNNLCTSSNTNRANQDNSLRINSGTGYENQRVINVTRARENVEQADWKDGTDDESDDQELEAHYVYMAQIQEVTPDIIDNYRPIFDTKPLQKDGIDELAQERDLLASLIKKLKSKIDDSKNRNKFLETSNKTLVDKLKGEIKDFKTKNKSLESSDNHFKEANNKLSKTKQLMFKDLKKFQAELDRTIQPIVVPISTKEPKQTMNQSVATSFKKTVATDSTVKKPRNITRKLYEHVCKTSSWWYPKFTPSGYKWKPKSLTRNVKTNVSMPQGNASRNANILEHMTPRCSTISNTPLSSNSFVARRDYPIHRRLWVIITHDGKSQASNGNDLLTGSHGTYLYSITLHDTSSPNQIFLMAKATSSQAWLWHRRLSHLNFDTINLLLKYNIMTGHPKLKFIKDHLCYSEDIRHEISTARTPKQNDVVKRWNRTLVEAARIMLTLLKFLCSSWLKQLQPHVLLKTVHSYFLDMRKHLTTSSMAGSRLLSSFTFLALLATSSEMTKDYPLEQVIGNHSQSIRTRCQLGTDGEICMFALIVSRTKPKNIKEAMADSAWIEAM